jgi:PhnB protein
MRLNPYLNFPGTCAEAFRFYEKALGGKIEMLQTHGESPGGDQSPPEWKDLVMHARLVAGDLVLMGSDAPPGQYKGAGNVYLSLQASDPKEGEKVFTALADQGKVEMPYEKTFWSPGFGMVVDRYGVPWMVNTDAAS